MLDAQWRLDRYLMIPSYHLIRAPIRFLLADVRSVIDLELGLHIRAYSLAASGGFPAIGHMRSTGALPLQDGALRPGRNRLRCCMGYALGHGCS